MATGLDTTNMSSPWNIMAVIAETRIREAMDSGAFDNLPGAGKPLALEDYSQIPEELRLAYRILKNSGYLPQELQDRKDAANILELLDSCTDENEKVRQMARLALIEKRMSQRWGRSLQLEEHDAYYQKILAKLAKE